MVLALKSEVVLAAQLVMRHRAPRLAALLALVVVALALLREDGANGGPRTVLLIGGIVAAVSGSRPLAPGAALACAYRAAAVWWLVPSGRLAGVLIATIPVTGVAAITLGLNHGSVAPFVIGVAAILYPAAVAAVALALTPVVGSSAASAVGFLAAWFGTVPPSVVQAALHKWPIVQGPAVLLWNTLPLNWRAVRWVGEGRAVDVLLLVGWVFFGVAAAGWAISAVYRSHRPPDEMVR